MSGDIAFEARIHRSVINYLFETPLSHDMQVEELILTGLTLLPPSRILGSPDGGYVHRGAVLKCSRLRICDKQLKMKSPHYPICIKSIIFELCDKLCRRLDVSFVFKLKG